jgi:DNA-binding CsgD family transcriptional regulator
VLVARVDEVDALAAVLADAVPQPRAVLIDGEPGSRGDLDGALAAAQRSLVLFGDLPVPFKRARTVLAIGQIRRRRREKGLAREALAAFEQLGTPVWADRARIRLGRVPVRRVAGEATDLVPTEEHIARLVVEGLTNREIAERTFLSAKTVEVNLTASTASSACAPARARQPAGQATVI